METTGRVDQHDVHPARPGRLQPIEDDCRRVRACRLTNQLRTRPLRPNGELLDGGKEVAEGIATKNPVKIIEGVIDLGKGIKDAF